MSAPHEVWISHDWCGHSTQREDERDTRYLRADSCPFCGEVDFDLVGLKIHLERGHCDEYNHTAIGVHLEVQP